MQRARYYYKYILLHYKKPNFRCKIHKEKKNTWAIGSFLSSGISDALLFVPPVGRREGVNKHDYLFVSLFHYSFLIYTFVVVIVSVLVFAFVFFFFVVFVFVSVSVSLFFSFEDEKGGK